MDTFNYSKAIKAAITKIQELTAKRDPNGWDSAHYFATDFEVGYQCADGGITCYKFATMQETYSYIKSVWENMLAVEADKKATPVKFYNITLDANVPVKEFVKSTQWDTIELVEVYDVTGLALVGQVDAVKVYHSKQFNGYVFTV